MKIEETTLNGFNIELISLNTVIVGTGAAGFNAADRLYSFGQKDIAMVTEGVNMGTSRNTGSDKQTYYKLTLAGAGADSVMDMAKTLFDGGAMDGDLALCEAALSARSFYRLAEIGVPFPHNEFGEYVGYKTDHDPRQRATSAGPLTSRYMVECLEEQVRQKGIAIFDGYQVIAVLTHDQRAVGLLTLNKNNIDEKRYTVFNTTNIIYATGGPAGLYECSVFPESQTGASGAAFEAGVMGKNLTEWQYGIASTVFRWNLSGTYQQVLPAYVSKDGNGGEKEFLRDYFDSDEAMLNAIFLKGYQWPFDVRKLTGNGSSIVDIAVYEQMQKGRRVFIDFRRNPKELKADFSNLSKEGYDYLKNSGAFWGLPIDRLAHMNRPAIELYRNNGIDLEKEPLEIAVCAQHNNGGLAVDCHWQTNLAHFFAVGEVCGSHGVYRPGGSALNAGQCGSIRAAQYIASRYREAPLSKALFLDTVQEQLQKKISQCETIAQSRGESTVVAIRSAIGRRMSRYGAHVRTAEGLKKALDEARVQLDNFNQTLSGTYELVFAMQNYDLLVCQVVYLSAMIDYIEQGGTSRGSFSIDGKPCGDTVPMAEKVQEAFYDGECCFGWRHVRPIPQKDDWFENVWNNFRRE